jgi:phage-related protein (TIGR01555 family)
MGVLLNIADKLSNALSGTGTARDIRSANRYRAVALTQDQIAAAYSGSGLIRKIVQIPAFDMIREWRDFTGLDDDQAAQVYDEEKRLGLRSKVRQAEILRGLGGGALILGLPGNPDEPAPKIGKNGLAFIHVVSRWHLSFDALSDDFAAEGYGEPAMWRMNTTAGEKNLHPSRVIPFRADTSAALAMPAWSPADAFWGESVVAQVLEAVQDSDTARASFAALVHKARLLRIGIPNLAEIASSPDGESKIQKRLAAVTLAESIHNASIYDSGNSEGKGGEEIKDATYSFTGAKDIINALGEFVAAISDIPATRLLGRAPEGMNASGDSQQKDWAKKVRAMQSLDLAPCLDRLDRYLVPSAIGSTPPTMAYEFAALDTETQAERASRFKTEAEAVQIVANLGHLPDEAMSRGVQSWMVEEGYLPELESALADLPDDVRFGIPPENSGEEVVGNLEGEGGAGEAVPSRRAANDAAPRPLYVRRNLLNGDDLVTWAKAQGFETTLPADDMHVTVLYSKQPVDWMKMGETWTSEPDGGLIVKAGGPREIEQFDGGAVVLQFASWSLRSRHAEMVEAGASHDFPEYLPHVTISYSAPDDFDPAKIAPYTGELRFGPEIFEPLDEDWKSKIEES